MSGFYRSAAFPANVSPVTVVAPHRPEAARPRRTTRADGQPTEELRVTRRSLRQAAVGAAAPGIAADAGARAGAHDATGPHPSEHPTEEVQVTRRALRTDPAWAPAAPEGPAGWSRRTVLVLASLALATVVLGTLFVTRTASAQGLRTEGTEAAAALTAALEAAQADGDALDAAVATARPAAGHARALADALAAHPDDVPAESLAAVVTAVEALEALVDEPTVSPGLAGGLADLSALPDAYVSAGRDREALRADVAEELERLADLGAQASVRARALADAVATASAAVGDAAGSAGPAGAATLAATPEASADSRARLEAAIAALAGLGDAPPLTADTQQAFAAYVTAADAARQAHADGVAAREAAERAAVEQALAEQEAAEREAEQEPERPWWWWWGDRDRRP